MTSREPVYLPHVSADLLVPVDPADSAIYRQRVHVIKGLITELEDENNLIAYKIAKTRRRIEEKRARLAARQPVEPPRGFWGSSSRAILPADNTEKRVKPTKKVVQKPRPKKEKERSGDKKPTPISVESAIPPMSSEELSHLRGSPSIADRMDLAPEGAGNVTRKPSGKITKAKNDQRESREVDSMDVDDFDDY